MLPNLLLLQPQEARAVLEYRLNRREGAAAKAASYGYAGLMFPWESAFSGYEVQGSAGGVVGPWGQYEQHISGDIALAAIQYWQVSGDKTLLASDLEPLLRGIAAFWASRVVKGDSDGKYHIMSVMGADEYNWPVNDSVYTNWVAKLSLLSALEASALTGRTPGANWSDIAENMYLILDEAHQYHPEYAGYQLGKQVKQASR